MFAALAFPSVKVAGANEPVLYNDINPEVACQSAGENPICALKTWIACEFTDSPVACLAVGHRPFKLQDDPYLPDEPFYRDLQNRPWRIPLSLILGADPGFWQSPGFSLIGYRNAGPERFESAIRKPTDEQIGTIEVMYSHADDAVATRYYTESIFLKRVRGHLIVVSTGYWENEEVSSTPCKQPEGSDARRYCDLSLTVEPWPIEFKKFARNIEPKDAYFYASVPKHEVK